MGVATDIKYGIANLLRRKPKPTVQSSKRIYAYTDKVFRSSGGAPDKLVTMYRTHAARHTK